MENAVYCFNSSSILICQNPDFRSRQEKWLALTKLLSVSWILSSGEESFFVQVLRWQKSMQTIYVDSFFQTNTTTLHHVLWLGWIVPESNISHKSAWTSSTNGGGICLNHSLNGTSSVTLITCFVEWVQLSLQGSREKMSWYSSRRDWAESASSGGQDPNSLKFNFSNSFSCLCSAVSYCGWMPRALSKASIIPGIICGSGTWLAATTLATRTFFFNIWGYAILFLTTAVVLLLPLCISV